MTRWWGRYPVAAAAALLASCTVQQAFFAPKKVDGEYRWDEGDPRIDGDLSDPHPSLVGPGDRREGFVEAGGNRIHYVFAHREGATDAILYSHGNSDHIGKYWDRVERLWQMGFHVLVYDYPGYGRSEGSPGEERIYASAEAALRVLAEQPEVSSDRIWLYGFSLGAAPSFELAVRARDDGSMPRPRGIVSESAFCSVEALLHDGAFLDLEDEFVTDLSFDNCAKIDDADLPVLVLHGTGDNFILPRHAKMLATRGGDDAELHLVDGATHSDVPLVLGERYETGIDELVSR